MKSGTGGHQHESMTDTIKCSGCGNAFKKAEKEYNRLQRTNPELFDYKEPEYPDSPELNEMRNQLKDRLRRDPMYKKHLYLSFKGTPSERKRENERANSGFYTKYSDYQAKKVW